MPKDLLNKKRRSFSQCDSIFVKKHIDKFKLP